MKRLLDSEDSFVRRMAESRSLRGQRLKLLRLLVAYAARLEREASAGVVYRASYAINGGRGLVEKWFPTRNEATSWAMYTSYIENKRVDVTCIAFADRLPSNILLVLALNRNGWVTGASQIASFKNGKPCLTDSK